MEWLNKIFEKFADLGLSFEPKNFVKMFSYMGKGMLIIFVIIAVIIISTVLINKIFSPKKENKE